MMSLEVTLSGRHLGVIKEINGKIGEGILCLPGGFSYPGGEQSLEEKIIRI